MIYVHHASLMVLLHVTHPSMSSSKSPNLGVSWSIMFSVVAASERRLHPCVTMDPQSNPLSPWSITQCVICVNLEFVVTVMYDTCFHNRYIF